ncbi:151_t:CDS:2 [Racocetra fulgida]|uniref:151_t:CDS:1 n=1 Tax=Racocetra fulgida TaxID=60492 RepID=A0A9N8VKB2_9GLOM|nr:151_t:CDS:2 [Racocetra fulgida]
MSIKNLEKERLCALGDKITTVVTRLINPNNSVGRMMNRRQSCAVNNRVSSGRRKAKYVD